MSTARGLTPASWLTHAADRTVCGHQRGCVSTGWESQPTLNRTPKPGRQTYLNAMPPPRQFQPCIPTRATKVPAGPDWIHEIKHDGYRLIVQKDHKRVRLFTRNGHDWTDRYPLIVESALKNRSSSFVIDGRSGATRRRRRVRFRWTAYPQA
jgi:ATP-dependent DNA ligase